MSESHARWRGRLVLVGLFALFFVPVIGAIVSFAINPSWVPFGAVNRGELIAPPRPLDLADTTPIGDSATLASKLSGRWTLLHRAPAACPDPCRIQLTAMRQARLALGKDADRVVRVWLISDRVNAQQARDVLDAFPGLIAAGTDRVRSELPAPSADAVYLLDPAGLVILRYRGDDAAAAMLKDLKRLLKTSKQG